MTQPSYQFWVFPGSALPGAERADLFNFLGEQDPVPPSLARADPQFGLEVLDLDRNRQINSQDQFYLLSPAQVRHALPSSQGMALLNYYADPSILRSRRLGMVVRSVEIEPGPSFPIAGFAGSDQLQAVSHSDLNEHIPFWEKDGHLDLDILEGRRVYTSQENAEWTGLGGLSVYFRWPFIRDRVIGRTAAFAGGFIAGEHFTNSAFMWQMYSTNFSSMILGTNQQFGEWNATMERAGGQDATHRTRRQANIETALARHHRAQENLYWTFTVPIVTLACFADPNFRKFWPAPWRRPRPEVLFRYFSNQFRQAVPAILRSPLGWGAALASGFGIYDISSAWFEAFGGLRRGSTANQVFSGASTILTEAALLSRASQEIRLLTGSGALNLQNLRALQALRPSLGFAVEFPQHSIAGRWWANRTGLQNFVAQRSWLPTVELNAAKGAERVFFEGRRFQFRIPRLGIPRFALESRVPASILALGEGEAVAGATPVATQALRTAAADTILTRTAILARGGAVAATGGEALAVAEAMMTTRRVRVIGLPLLALGVGVGIGLGIGYATGVFDDDYTVRDAFRDVTGF